MGDIIGSYDAVRMLKQMTYLVITGAEDEIGIRVFVHETLDDLSLVDSQRPDFEILLTDQNYKSISVRMLRPPIDDVCTKNRTLTLDGSPWG